MSGGLAGKRLLVVEEGLKDSVGHWYEYVKAVVELNRAEGVEVVTVAHAGLDPAIAAELPAIPAFVRSNWDGVYRYPQAWRRYLGVFQHNWLVFRTMSRIVDAHGPFDCLFAPTVIVHHALGWRLLLAAKGSRIGRMVLLVRNNAGGYAPGSTTPVFRRSAAMLRWSLKSFAGAIRRGRMTLATDSTRLAREYELFCGITPEVYPSPRITPFPDQVRPAKGTDEPLVFACLGPARFEKGIDLLQEAIRLCLARGLSRPVRFVIQWNMPIHDAEGRLYEPAADLRASGAVEFVEQPLDSDAYAVAIDATDCMLLPYRRDAYFARISGVAVEGATAGIPMIYTNETWTADLADEVGAGIGVDDGDVPGLADAITVMVDRYVSFREAAMGRRALAQQAHSGETFVARLWGRG